MSLFNLNPAAMAFRSAEPKHLFDASGAGKPASKTKTTARFAKWPFFVPVSSVAKLSVLSNTAVDCSAESVSSGPDRFVS